MEGGTVKPDEISTPIFSGFEAKPGVVNTSHSTKRARTEDEDSDDEDGFDPEFETDRNYVDDGASTSGAGAMPGRARQRTPSNGEPKERRPINIEFIQDKSRRHITFSKRKAGIMKKAYELSTLTGTQVLLLIVSETGLVYTYTTTKLAAIVNEKHGQVLIEECLHTEEGETPPFAQREYDQAEPSLTIKRSNGTRSPRSRHPSGSGRSSMPGGEGRRTSSRHASASGLPAMPSPRRQPSNPHLAQSPPPVPHMTMPPGTMPSEPPSYQAVYGHTMPEHAMHGQTMSISPWATSIPTQRPDQHDWQQ